MTVSQNCVYEPKTEAVMAILEYHGWDVYREIEPRWTGFIRKVHYAHEMAKELTQYDYLLLMDARDVVVLEDPQTVLDRFLEFDQPWVCAAEPNIWPIGMYRSSDYPPGPVLNPYRYLNSGAYIAERGHLLDCLDRWPRLGRDQVALIAKGEDGAFLTEFYIREPGAITLDHECRLFQCMCGSDWCCEVTPGHVHNALTDTDPLVIHYNGGTNITAPDRSYLWQHWV